ncbi:MAG: type II secretion system protein N [Mariprofundaceae bacterium]|nr:type II secretion system protein N [Mariprofundaceae bacterium]
MAKQSLANIVFRDVFAVVNIWQSWFVRMPRLIELLLVVMLAWVVSAWWMTSDNAPKTTPITDMTEQSVFPDITMEEWAKVALFGEIISKPVVQKPVVKKPAAPKPVVVSRLNIKLLGTVVAGSRSAAVVMMDASPKQQVFFLGDTMQAGVTLESVEVDAIVVDHQGKSERILLNKKKAIAGASIKKAVPLPVSAPVQRVMNRSYLNRQIRNFPKLLSQARVMPSFKEGRPNGFVISDIVSGSLYEKIGLQNGDIIRKVNGQSITSAEQGMAMYQALQNASAIDLEIQRGTAIVPIHYAIQ